MTADEDSPREGQDSTESRSDYPPRTDATDEEIALALEERKQDARHAVDDVTAALLNEDEPLTDEKVHGLWKAANALTALSDALCLRVPEEHRTDSDEGIPEYDQ